jgi:preprotein translocase subunit SecB
MKDSPLQLERHIFKRVEIVASDKPDQGAVNLMNVQLRCAQAAGEPNRFLIGLGLKLLPHPDSHKTPQYTGEIFVEGEFRIAEDVPADRQQVTVIANGAGILFGAIREMVLNVTSRGPWPPLMLKTLHFIDMANEMVAQTEARDSELPAEQKAFSPVVPK